MNDRPLPLSGSMRAGVLHHVRSLGTYRVGAVMTTPAQFPVTIGKITFKGSKLGPMGRVRKKRQLALHASLLRSVSSSNGVSK